MKFTPYALLTILSAACATDPNSLEQGVVDPDAPVSNYGIDVPLAYYNLSFTLSKRTGGITPPVQARIYAYTGLALYEALAPGMARHKSIAPQLNRSIAIRLSSGQVWMARCDSASSTTPVTPPGAGKRWNSSPTGCSPARATAPTHSARSVPASVIRG